MRRRLFLGFLGLFSILALLGVSLLTGCSARKFARAGAEGPEAVEGGVLFRFYDPDAKRVNLVGDFNGWSPSADPMVDKNGDGVWTLFYPLAPGTYEYKFVIDGLYWVHDPSNPASVPDRFEGRNSVVRVPAAE